MCVGMVCNRTENVNNILMHEFIRNFELIDKKIQLRLASLHAILDKPKSIKGLAPIYLSSIKGDKTTDSKQYSPTFSWSSDNQDAVVRYEYSIGTQKGKTNIYDWTSLGNKDFKRIYLRKVDYRFNYNKRYYFNLRDIDKYERPSKVNSTYWVIK